MLLALWIIEQRTFSAIAVNNYSTQGRLHLYIGNHNNVFIHARTGAKKSLPITDVLIQEREQTVICSVHSWTNKQTRLCGTAST